MTTTAPDLTTMEVETWTSDRTLARFGLATFAAVLTAVYFSTPGQSSWLPSCLFFKFTGLYCPGCGTTRMLYNLLHGRPIEALRCNALTLLALPLVVYGLVCKSAGFRLPAFPCTFWRRTTALTVLIILFSVARNLPEEPFCKLAPDGSCCPHSVF